MNQALTVEERLAVVERELAEIKQRLTAVDPSTSWIERIAGTFADDPDFAEIVRLGREFRKSTP